MEAYKAEKQKLAAKYGGVFLKPSKDRYQPGEQFDGIINLNLLETYPGDSIVLVVKCAEKWMRSYITRDGKHTKSHLGRNKHVVMDMKLPVYKNEGRELQPGQYAFPVSFLIPSQTPPSFYQEGHEWVASIEFKVKVRVETFEPLAPKLEYKEQIIIQEEKVLLGEPMQKTETIPLRECCCRCGETTISLGLEKNALIPGETTNLIFKVDNSQSKYSFARAKCELVEKISLGPYFKFNYNAVVVKLPGVKSKESLPEQKVQLTLPPYNPEKLKVKRIPYKRLTYNTVHTMKDTPNELHLTTQGKSLNVQYFLAVELYFSGIACSFTSPTIMIPVQVFVPSYTLAYNDVVAPLDWNPQVMPVANLTIVMASDTNNLGGQQQGQLVSKMQANDNYMKPQQNSDYNTFSRV
mgnify:FL=1